MPLFNHDVTPPENFDMLRPGDETNYTIRPVPTIIADAAIPFLRGRLEPFAVVRYMPGAEIGPEHLRDADALIVRTRTRCYAALLDQSPVKFIATATIGTDHLDLPYLESRGISVANAPGCNAPAVAQWVHAAILAAGKGVRQDSPAPVLGVVGLGHVGSIVAEWGRGLGFRVIACDPPRAQAGDPAENWLTLPQLIAEADIVTVHVPFTRDGSHPTAGLIDAEAIRMLRPGAMLLNASRGGIVDEEALLSRLKSGDITAAIDTWSGEPDIDRSLLSLCATATPHIAGYSLEGKQRATRMAIEATARHFGFPSPDISGLAAPYKPYLPSADQILASYDIQSDTAALRRSPQSFELLRNSYQYRREPETSA